MNSREKLENAVIARYRKEAPKWGISSDDAEKRAREMLTDNSDAELRQFLRQPSKGLSINYLDPAHRDADKELAKMSLEVKTIYERAADEMQQKLDKYLEKFNELVEKKKKQLAEGKITQAEFDDWYQEKLRSRILHTKTWEEMRDTLAEDASRCNDIARSTIYGHMPEVYSNNFNFATYQIERDTQLDTAFTLYDRDTVERLMRSGQTLMPPPSYTEHWKETSIDITRSMTAKKKDIQWNSRAIQSELVQGILQGESVPNLAKRIRHVQLMNNKASIRYARTMTTAAENAGRMEANQRARDMGIKFKEYWRATLDFKTRLTHRVLDGEAKNEKTGMWSNGCRYPGDPECADESEVWNCRCTTICRIDGFDNDPYALGLRNLDALEGMSYEEWKSGKDLEKAKNEIKSRKALEAAKNEIKSGAETSDSTIEKIFNGQISRVSLMMTVTGVKDKKEAEKNVDIIQAWCGNTYSGIRAYQQGKISDEETEKILKGYSDTIEKTITESPKWKNGITYRGIHAFPDEISYLQSIVGTNTPYDMNGTASWSTQLIVAKDHTDEINGLIFECPTQNKGTCIMAYSQTPYEYEVLVSKKSNYLIKSVSKDENGYVRVKIEEI